MGDLWEEWPSQIEYFDDGERFGTGPEIIAKVRTLTAELAAAQAERDALENIVHQAMADYEGLRTERDQARRWAKRWKRVAFIRDTGTRALRRYIEHLATERDEAIRAKEAAELAWQNVVDTCEAEKADASKHLAIMAGCVEEERTKTRAAEGDNAALLEGFIQLTAMYCRQHADCHLQWAHDLAGSHHPGAARLTELADLRERVRVLEKAEAVMLFAQHQGPCQWLGGDKWRCVCGYDAARAEYEKHRTSDAPC